MNTLEKKKLILQIVKNSEQLMTARDIFLVLCISYPKKSEFFKSPMEIAKLIESIKEIKFRRIHPTSPKIYYI